MRTIFNCRLPAAYCLLAIACCLLPAVATAQCPGGCCPNGQCVDYSGWRSSPPQRTQVLPPLPPAPVEPAEADNQPTLAERECFRSVVRIKTVDRDGAHSYGSGAAVLWGNRLVILTASHVVRDAREIYARGKTGYHRASIMKRGFDQTWDVAVLATHTADDFLPAVKLAYRATGHPRPGETLFSCGFGGNDRLKINRGHFRRYARSMRDSSRTDWLIMSGTARGGDSGGPVFNSRGELVGVLWGCDDGRKTKLPPTVVATQCGRLHVLMRASLGEPVIVKTKSRAVVKHRYNGSKSKTVARERKITTVSYPTPVPEKKLVPVQPTGLFNRDRGPLTCRPKPPAPPQVIVQNDPNVSRKLDVLIQNTTPPAAPIEPEKKEPPTSPIVMLLVIGGAVALGFVVYFGSQRGN